MMLKLWSDLKYLRNDRFGYHAQEAWQSWKEVCTQVQRKVGTGLGRDVCLLDIGCGRFYPHLILFERIGARATGIDLESVLQHTLNPFAIRHDLENLGRRDSPYQIVRAFARNCYHRWVFYRPLAKHAGSPLMWRHFDIRRMDATNMSLGDASFDVVISNDTFEHIMDIPKAIAEVCRVLKPDGFAVISIHLFPSLTGGHEPELGYHRIRKKLDKPWAHLWDSTWQPPYVLNKWRDQEYLQAFKDRFLSVERIVVSEFGREFLSSMVLNKLTNYTVDELLTEKVMYILNR